MKTKECPSCAMNIPANDKVCPICQHEFASYSLGIRGIAIALLIILLLLYFIF
jgi:RNA polymerase subunit RPABC4/transcription elongation factor Spt4